MEVVKRNLYSIICGVIAIIAVIVVFYPLGGMFEGLQTQLNESKNDYDTIRSLLSKEHTAPMVDVENAEQRKIDRFPTPRWIEAGKAAVTKVQEQSLQLLEKAMAMNQKAPLVAEALPSQRTGAAFSAFKREYYDKLHDFKKRLNATNAPTNDEVLRQMELIRRDMEQNRGIAGDFGRGDIDMELQMKELTLPDELGRKRAAEGSIYVSADAGGGTGGGAIGDAPELMGLKSFDVHHPGVPTPSQQGFPKPTDVWAAQLSLWIQEDIVEAIAATNQSKVVDDPNARGIPASVIKRLHEIRIPKEYVTKRGRVPIVDTTTTGYRPIDPTVPPPDPNAPEDAGAEPEDPSKPPKDGKQSATGRICNSMYDVVHFHVVVDCDAARFRDFMANLVNNRHITILTVDFEGVDRNQEYQVYYYYGDRPVVRLKLTCEALFFRKWTLPLMPEDVKKLLNVTPPAEAGGDTMAMP